MSGDNAVKRELIDSIETEILPGELPAFYAYLVGHLSTMVSQQVWELAVVSAHKHILETRLEELKKENQRLKAMRPNA